MTIRAIETVYAGHRFRSRLEARWAVFFDHLDIEWLYEPQGFTVDGHTYLPDFWLPNVLDGCHVEVRPPGHAPPDEQTRLSTIVAKGLPGGLLLLGEPYRPNHTFRHTRLVRWHDETSKFFPHRYFGTEPFIFAHDVRFTDSEIALHAYSGIQGAVGRGDSIWRWHDDGGPAPLGPHESAPASRSPMTLALKAARSARFEHGQHGAH